MKSFVMRALLPGLLSVAALSPASAQQQATGAGASFPAPLYAKWAAGYHQATGVKINYQSVGSSAGLRQIEAKTVDFGASDAPLTDDELAAKGLVQFPTVVGGVIVAPRASELIYPIAIAIERRLTVDQVARVFAAYPSLTTSITDATRAMHGISGI